MGSEGTLPSEPGRCLRTDCPVVAKRCHCRSNSPNATKTLPLASLSVVPQMVYKHQCLLLRIYSLIKVNRNQVMNMVVFSQGSLEKTTALLQVFLECFCLCSGGNGDFRAAMLLKLRKDLENKGNSPSLKFQTVAVYLNETAVY